MAHYDTAGILVFKHDMACFDMDFAHYETTTTHISIYIAFFIGDGIG